ncbi:MULTISPECIES: CocE/NonD family hydrolase [unclassified Leifsonia]|uniref:CocE/NonD family hydrolase n=1 Tax=unclassified Leifsonia TaxID=2663824 RepID=UPI000B7DB0E4|nr:MULTISPECIES: CocE/NonD family hydrolase [unclassified Leifsonia]
MTARSPSEHAGAPEGEQQTTVLYRPGNPLSLSEPPIPEFRPGTRLLPAASVHAEGARPLPVDIEVFDDVAITLSDGTTLYADVYRRAGTAAIPAILLYTIYSKRGGYWNANVNATRFGVPAEQLSGLQPFEALDPAAWCQHGYALVVVDARGTGHSGGDFRFLGSTTAGDVADVVEWTAAQTWCTGKVGMAGNSYLAMAQWAGAAERPPHLAAIAPWEGATDVFRDILMRGGIPDLAFHDADIVGHLYGNGRFEDVTGTLLSYPHEGAYWADKRPELESIEVPAYVVASWTNSLHTRSTLRAYERLGSEQKWLRIHNTHEWVDIADPDRLADLRRFFDRYLKGESNDWETTPRVRYSILELDDRDLVDIPALAYPPVDATATPLHLDANAGTLVRALPAESGTVGYDTADPAAAARFVWPVEVECMLVGPLNLHLRAETSDGDDMDLFASVYVTDADGTVRFHVPYPAQREAVASRARDGRLTASDVYLGPTGRIRASRRALDPRRSTLLAPYLAHDRDEPLSPREPVDLDIGLWPSGLHLRPGQRLVLEIASRPGGPLPPSPTVTGLPAAQLPTRNAGRHTIHTGPHAGSTLYVPLVAAR